MALPFSSIPNQPCQPVVRCAIRADADQIWELVSSYAAEGLMLPRTLEQMSMNIDNYVVAVVSGPGRCMRRARGVLAFTGRSFLGGSREVRARKRPGTEVVLGVERLARARDIDEIFALSLTDGSSFRLDYEATSISRYPEKLARYEQLCRQGVEIIPKRCFQKILGGAGSARRWWKSSGEEHALRAS